MTQRIYANPVVEQSAAAINELLPKLKEEYIKIKTGLDESEARSMKLTQQSLHRGADQTEIKKLQAEEDSLWESLNDQQGEVLELARALSPNKLYLELIAIG